MSIHALRASFSGGEISPILDSRVDAQKYGTGCRFLRNMIPLVQGAAFRRGGTEYMGAANDATATSLFEWTISDQIRFILEMGAGYGRAWDTDGLVAETDPFVHPYTEDELKSVQFVTVNRIAFFTHPNHPPQQLSYETYQYGADFWTRGTEGETPGDNQWTTSDATATPNLQFDITFTDNAGFELIDVGTVIEIVQVNNENRSVTYTVDTVNAVGDFEVTRTATGSEGEPEESQDTTAGWTLSASVVSFLWQAVNFDFPPMRPYGDNVVDGSAVQIQFSGSAVEALGEVPIFLGTSSDWTGTLLEITQKVPPVEIKLTAAPTTEFPQLIVEDWSVTTTGTWTGTLTIWEYVQDKVLTPPVFNAANSTWQVRKKVRSPVGNTANFNLLFNNETPRWIYVDFADSSAAGADPVVPGAGFALYFDVAEGQEYDALFRISAISDSHTANVTTVRQSVTNDPSEIWRFSAFSGIFGYPKAVAYHEQRVWYGGTEGNPGGLWGSRLNDFRDFEEGPLDTDSITVFLPTTRGTTIESLVSHVGLVIFTTLSEFVLLSSEQSTLTPASTFLRKSSEQGSDYTQGLVASGDVLFLQRGGRRLRNYQYNGQLNGGVSQNLSIFADHLTLDGDIEELAFQQVPEMILWAVTSGGTLLSMTYDSDQEVFAWAAHPIEGTVISVGIVVGQDVSQDEVWILVERSGIRSLERIDPGWMEKVEKEQADDYRYLDSFVAFDYGAPSATITGLEHLEGRTDVEVYADRENFGPFTVTGGQVTLPQAVSKGCAGIPFVSLLTPTRFEFGMQDGTGQGRTQICKRFVPNLYRTRGLQYADTPDSSTWLDMPAQGLIEDADGFITGEVELLNRGRHDFDVEVSIRQNKPFPLNVLGIVYKLETLGD